MTINTDINLEQNIAQQFSNDLTEPDIDIEYYCSNEIKSKGFTLLMKCVMLYKDYPQLYHSLSESFIHDQINKRNEKGWTALMLACRNSNIYFSRGNDGLTSHTNNEIVKLLLDAGADVNLEYENGLSVLDITLQYFRTESSTMTMKYLLDAGATINHRY